MQYTSIDQFTDDALVEKFISLRDKLATETARLAEEIKRQLGPFQLAMDTIEGELHRRLLARGENTTSCSTTHGTFFFAESMRLRVVDQGAFIQYVFDNRATDMIAAAATKDGVRAYMATRAAEVKAALAAGITLEPEAMVIEPPGVEVTFVQNLTVRRK